MNLTLAYSPCPNDTFAFHAMVHNLVDTEGLTFSVELADIEQLNKRADLGSYDVCKLSYHAFFYLCDKYAMLRSGSALGYNNGPLFITRADTKIPSDRTEFSKMRIAIPGERTTGALLLSIAFPECKNLTPVLFSEIEQRVVSGEFDAGVLIHEGRFTYQSKGLKLIEDLGYFWQQETGTPIPLGGIAISRKFDSKIQQKVNRILKKSIEFAFSHPELSKDYVGANAQEMDKEIQKKHIELFVNNYSLDISEEGERAVYTLYSKAIERDPMITKRDNLFIL